MTARLAVLLALGPCIVACASPAERSVSPSITIVALHRDAIDLVVDNRSANELVLLASPSSAIDQERCALELRTNVSATDPLPYAFTPKLERVPARTKRRVRVEIIPMPLAGTHCRNWRIDATFAYVSPPDAVPYEQGRYDEFRNVVIERQKLLRAVVSKPMTNP